MAGKSNYTNIWLKHYQLSACLPVGIEIVPL